MSGQGRLLDGAREHELRHLGQSARRRVRQERRGCRRLRGRRRHAGVPRPASSSACRVAAARLRDGRRARPTAINRWPSWARPAKSRTPRLARPTRPRCCRARDGRHDRAVLVPRRRAVQLRGRQARLRSDRSPSSATSATRASNGHVACSEDQKALITCHDERFVPRKSASPARCAPSPASRRRARSRSRWISRVSSRHSASARTCTCASQPVRAAVDDLLGGGVSTASGAAAVQLAATAGREAVAHCDGRPRRSTTN